MSIWASFSHRLEISSAAAMEEIKLLAMASGVRRRSRENANDLKSDPRHHLAQHDRRRPVHARGAQRKAQADRRAEGLAESRSPFRNRSIWDHLRGELFWIEKFPARRK